MGPWPPPSGGRVWVAWQGWRNGRAAVFAATQRGNTISKPAPVGRDHGKQVERHRRGRKRQHHRRLGFVSVATTISSCAPRVWGLGRGDAGGCDAKKRPIPRSPTIPAAVVGGLRGGLASAGAGRRLEPPVSRSTRARGALWASTRTPGVPACGGCLHGAAGAASQRIDDKGRQSDSWGGEARSRRRTAASTGRRPMSPRPAIRLPRLTVDSSGRVWLVAQHASIWWNPLGLSTPSTSPPTTGGWTGPVFLAHSDGVWTTGAGLRAGAS